MLYRVDDITGLSPWYSGNERAHQQIFKSLVRNGDLVIDVGANWGVHTLYLSKLVGPSGLVVACEPFPTAIDELNWHLKTNGCLNVKVIDKAASDEDGEAVFFSGESAQTGGLTEASSSSKSLKQITVKTKRLDSILRDIHCKRVRLIKIDVEGAESKVLLGAKQIIEEYQPYLVVDLHTPEQDLTVARLLTDWHYVLTRLSGPPIVDLDKSWPNRGGVWGTILATPKSNVSNN